MSGTTPQPALQEACRFVGEKRRPGLSCLLHAVNQPLTGLQCSLELAATRQRSADEYLDTIREALALTERLRALVEALREAIELPFQSSVPGIRISVDPLIRETVDQLRPIAESRGLLIVETYSAPVDVALQREFFGAQLFRLLEAAISLTERGGKFKVSTNTALDEARISVSWDCSQDSDRPSASRADLSLLVTQALWEQVGAEWEQDRTGDVRRYTIRVPLFERRRP